MCQRGSFWTLFIAAFAIRPTRMRTSRAHVLVTAHASNGLWQFVVARDPATRWKEADSRGALWLIVICKICDREFSKQSMVVGNF